MNVDTLIMPCNLVCDLRLTISLNSKGRGHHIEGLLHNQRKLHNILAGMGGSLDDSGD